MSGLIFQKVEFNLSAFSLKQLPDEGYPEVAFAGRSNVGKSSLINKIVNRTNYVKTSSKPGKTQSLNYFTIDQQLYFVDLPGYGFAKVPKKMRNQWDTLITSYLLNRENLKLVIVIVDIRHETKALDRTLVDWLQFNNIPCQLVYTKCDKLTRNKQAKHAGVLDAGLGLTPDQRVIVSSKTGQGCDDVKERIENICLAH